MQDFWKNVKIVYDYLRDPQLGNVWKAMTAASAAIKFLVDTFNESFWASFDAASAPVMMWSERKQKEIAAQLETLHGKYSSFHPQSMSTTDIFNIIRLLVQAGSLIMSGWSSLAVIAHAKIKTTCDSGGSDVPQCGHVEPSPVCGPVQVSTSRAFDILYTRLVDAYYTTSPTAAAIDRDLIYTIIGIVLDLLASCRGTTGAAVVQMARNPGRREDVLLRQGVRRGLREKYGLLGYLRHDGDRIVTMLLAEGGASTPEFIDALIETPG